MSVQELIEKHVGADKVFEEKFHALSVKEALGTISLEELSELDRMTDQSGEQITNEMDSENLKHFAIDLLEAVKESAPFEVRYEPSVYVGMTEAHRNYGLSIDKALEELRK